ncbi:Late embryogenesis abundantlike protein 1 [Phytophthora megakarya]|uniref:Late embryogenesis abundantlike protein 1 n=1 Tax=Phytophthora megakarya TaxID=4795 RepID=A0A225WRC9_9STRA|nr:Late embryogenesis abundantlike protein 1 [Phytophthora megakarya]
MVRMPTSMAKNKLPKDQSAKEQMMEKVDEMISEAEQMRQSNDRTDRGRRTLEQLQEDARNLGDYARGKMEHVNEVMGEAAASTGISSSAPAPTNEAVMDSLKTASEKLSAEINELGERVENVKARVHQSMQAAGGKAKDTWHQSAEAAKNVGEREYCLPLPVDRICARHVAYFAFPLLILFLLVMLRRRYPKKWKASVNKMKQPRMMLAREMPSSDQLKSQLGSVAENIEGKIEYGKQRGSAKLDEVRTKYGQPENKKDQ